MKTKFVLSSVKQSKHGSKGKFLSQFARQCGRTILFGEIEKADLNGKSNNASHDASLVCGADKAKA
jgi:hypothetical protein